MLGITPDVINLWMKHLLLSLEILMFMTTNKERNLYVKSTLTMKAEESLNYVLMVPFFFSVFQAYPKQ